MGANAQIAVPAFTAGQVLTAAQQTQINTGIPVFATTTTRDAAFGGTGEKVLAQGQYAYIEATSTLQTYNGSAWVSAIGSPGLAFISNTSITTTASTTITNCFTSTYRDYRIVISGISSGDTNWILQLRAGGTTTTTNYNRQRLVATSTSVSANFASGNTGQVVGNSLTGQRSVATVDIFNPQQALRTGYLSNFWGPDYNLFLEGGQQTDTTQFDSLVFTTSPGTFTGTVAIYGYAIA